MASEATTNGTLTQASARPKYYDLHENLWRQAWAAGVDWAGYLDSADPKHRQRWDDAIARTGLSAEQAARAAGLTRPLNLLVMSGTWCGDCVHHVPILNHIVEAMPHATARYIDRDAMPDLRDELLINGAMKVPVALFLNEHFQAIHRFGDRPLSAYRAKAAREIGAACETGIVPPSDDATRVDIDEWLNEFERAYWILRTAPQYRKQYSD